MVDSPPGVFIVFEGNEGAGKSSQLAAAAAALERRGHDVLTTAQPGGTGLGQSLRTLLLDQRDFVPTPTAELFLYLADRAQHVDEVIRPALQAGRVVLLDRFSASTIAYQGYGRGLDVERVTEIERWARRGLEADLTIWLDCPVGIGLERAGRPDRFHREAEAFHQRVRDGFGLLCGSSNSPWHRIDSTRQVDQVRREIEALLLDLLESR